MFKSKSITTWIISGLVLMTTLMVVYTLSATYPVKSEEQATIQTEGYGALGAFDDKELTIDDMLNYAVQDEYLAHSEYVAIMDKFDVDRPYSNIAKSELTHLDLLKELYDTRNVEFPTDQSSSHLIIPETLLSAAETGVVAEINNIAMYELFLEYDLPDDVRDVFEALMNGSVNHLRAFERQVERLS